MSQQIFPEKDLIFKFKGYEGSEPVTAPDGTVLASVVSGEDGVSTTFVSERMDGDFEAWVYCKDDNGIIVTDENRAVIALRATQVPSFFDKFEFYLEDCNGVVATYGLDDDELGKVETILRSAVVFGESFNTSYVVRIGIHVKGPKMAGKPFRCTVSAMSFSSSEHPTYASPQDIADFLGIVTNRNEPLIVTEATIPSYSTLAKRIVEAEAWFENTTKAVFSEHRVLNEYRNADTALSTDLPYLGLYAQSFSGPNGSFYKGAPVKLIHRQIQPIDYEKGDKVEVRRFGSNWVTVPNEQIWADEAKGILYIKALFFQTDTSVRVTYRYGQAPPPQDAKRAVILKTAMLVMETDWFRTRFPVSPDFNPSKNDIIKMWTWELKDLIRPYTCTFTVGGV